MMAPPRRVRALNVRTRVRERTCVWGSLERVGGEPSSEAEPARGSHEPSGEAEPARGRCEPSSEAEPARGGLWVGRSGGPRGPPQCGPCPVCALKWDAFSFVFLQVLSRISPVVLGDPQGCPRQTSSPLILGRSFLKIVGAIDIGKGEIKFDIDGVRSAFKSTMIRGMQHDSC
jgi:hypothetical protein